jgi:hypothetical protein
MSVDWPPWNPSQVAKLQPGPAGLALPQPHPESMLGCYGSSFSIWFFLPVRNKCLIVKSYTCSFYDSSMTTLRCLILFFSNS